MKLNPPQAIPLDQSGRTATPSLVHERAAAVALAAPIAPARTAHHALRTLILLDGTMRQSPLLAAVRRSALGLPVSAQQTLLSLWHEQARALAQAMCAPLHCRIVISEHCQPPAAPADDPLVRFTVERDPAPLRGTGGLLRDLVTAYEDDDCLLAAPAAQVLLEPIAPVITRALAAPGHVKLFVTATSGCGSAPTDIYLFSPRAIRAISTVGYVDFKEQVLPAIAREHEVVVVAHPRPLGLPIRTAQSYLGALKAHHLAAIGSPAASDPLAERWQSTFRIVEEGAEVHRSARLTNSVVLAGARVAAGAFLANCIVCRGARVSRGAMVIDKLITAGGAMCIAAA